MIYTTLFAVFIFLNAVDCYLTIRGLKGSDNIREKNPVALLFIKLFGLEGGLILLKVLGVVLFYFLTYDTPAWVYFFVVANAGYGFLVHRNYRTLRRNGVRL